MHGDVYGVIFHILCLGASFLGCSVKEALKQVEQLQTSLKKRQKKRLNKSNNLKTVRAYYTNSFYQYTTMKQISCVFTFVFNVAC